MQWINTRTLFFNEKKFGLYSCSIFIPEVANFFLPDVDYNNSRGLQNIGIELFYILNNYFHTNELARFKNFKTFKRQIEWISGRIAIKKLVSSATDSQDLLNTIIIDKENNGAPYLSEFPVWFISISHSHDYAVAALNCNKGKRMGIDIEKIKRINNVNGFMDIAFTKIERESILDNTYSEIYKKWTIKEAFLKYLKLGFEESLKNVEIVDDKVYYKLKHQSNLKVITEFIDKSYVVSAVYDK